LDEVCVFVSLVAATLLFFISDGYYFSWIPGMEKMMRYKSDALRIDCDCSVTHEVCVIQWDRVSN